VDQSTGNVTKIEFKDGSIVEPASQTPYISKEKMIFFDDGDYKLQDLKSGQSIDLHLPKNEYIFQELIQQIQKVNPDEKLNRTAKTIPFIQAHMMGRQLPLIFFLWQQLGLIETLTRYHIDYEVGAKALQDRKSSIEIPLTGGNFIFIYPENKRQELLVNGLLQLPKGFSIEQQGLSSRTSIDDFLNSKYGNRTTFNFDLMMDNIIDPTTKDLLEFEDKPTNFIDLVNGPMMDKLLNDQPDHPADLKNLRLRQAEVLTNLLYSELCMSMNKYNTDLSNGVSDAKLYFHPDYIIMNLLGRHAHSAGDDSAGGVMDYNTTFSPVDELFKASKLIKTGPGGVPSKRAFRKEHRSIHPSYIGNVASHSTSEYASVGIVNTLTLGASISNNYGGFGGKRANYTKDNIDSLSIDEYLTPFVGHLDSERLVIARTHISQKVPIINGDLPLIETGAEYLVPQLTSTKFAHTAKQPGKVLAVSPNEYITIQYEDGKIENLDIMPRYTATKRNSTIQISLNNLEIGDTFQKGQMVAWSKAFNGDGLVIGKNVMLAVMNYRGLSFEDAYVISESMSNGCVSENVLRVPIIIPAGTKVLNVITDKFTQTDSSTPLVEFQYMKSVDEYIASYDMLGDDFNEDEDSIFSKGMNTLKRMSPGGEIVDIKIKINTKTGVDPLLINLWEQQRKTINRLEKTLTKHATTEEESLVDNIDMSVLKVGGHKVRAKEFDGVLIEYYVKQPMPIQLGNKIANRYGAKGCVGYIIPEESTPKGEYTPNIDIFIQPSGVLG
jgi:DNA-directed RNA polymerase beta subunit